MVRKIQHIFRNHFRTMLGQIAAKATPEEARIMNDMANWPQILKTHGIMPASTELDDAGLKQTHAERPTHKNMPLLGDKAHQHFETWLLPFLGPCNQHSIIIYTDGACSDQGRLDLARAGYGIFDGPAHPWNESHVLHGCHQASDRAELAAVVRVLVANIGNEPIWVTSLNSQRILLFSPSALSALILGKNYVKPTEGG